MELIITTVITLGGLGVLFGAVLAVGARVFHVQIDPRLEKILDLMPQLNCGACGYGGCLDCARAMLDGKAEPTACPICDHEAREKIAELLGRLLKEEEQTVARIFCRGGYDAARRYLYDGVQTCQAANQIEGGVSACDYGCLRYYTCKAICPFGAIEIDSRGNPVVNPDKCRSCGLCVQNCPRNIIHLVPAASAVDVLCSSRAKGKAVVKVCGTGCIGCGKCVKECPVGAITMEDNLARIDYEKCTACGRCVEVCPRNIIERVSGRTEAAALVAQP